MPDTPSRMGLHLMYRLWIAELNHNINLLRIFDDYLLEAKTKSVETDITEKIDVFKKNFTDLRTEIDELRHSMHLVKMKLASEARQQEVFPELSQDPEEHPVIQKNYQAFQRSFEKTNSDVRAFIDAHLQ